MDLRYGMPAAGGVRVRTVRVGGVPPTGVPSLPASPRGPCVAIRLLPTGRSVATSHLVHRTDLVALCAPDGKSLGTSRVGETGVICPARAGDTVDSDRAEHLRLPQRGSFVTYVIAQPCVDIKDRACVDECPVDCIYEGKRMLYIHPDECVDCGACEPVCPVEAIYYEDDTPTQWSDYYRANVEFFDDLGSPGGAAKMGVIDKDDPMIAALPPQA